MAQPQYSLVQLLNVMVVAMCLLRARLRLALTMKDLALRLALDRLVLLLLARNLARRRTDDRLNWLLVVALHLVAVAARLCIDKHIIEINENCRN